MFQVAGRLSRALQLRTVPRLLTQTNILSPPQVQVPSTSSTNSFSQSAAALDLPTSAQDYTEQQIAEIRQRVFGTHIGNGLPSGRKLLRKKLMGEKIAAYYAHAEPLKDPLIVNLEAERRGVQLAALKRRGKGPPKKGQGKRAGKKRR